MATATMMKIRGGSVDKGYPVCEAASKLYSILSNVHMLCAHVTPIADATAGGYIAGAHR